MKTCQKADVARVWGGGVSSFSLLLLGLSRFGENLHKTSVFNNNSRKQTGFTLAEVLITLGIIGVVAAMTLPTLVAKYQEKQFKTAYKKVYSELQQVVQQAMFNQEFTRTEISQFEATKNEMDILKSKFKVIEDCPPTVSNDKCWAPGILLCGGSCGSGNSSDGLDMDVKIPVSSNSCFTDASGRNWCTYYWAENLFYVDTNGFQKPNSFGKDRFIFTFCDAVNKRARRGQDYRKICPFADKDFLNVDAWCKEPPCYYHSWLYE